MNTNSKKELGAYVLRVFINFVRYCIFLVIVAPAEGDAFSLGGSVLGVLYAIIFLIVSRIIVRACFRARSLTNL